MSYSNSTPSFFAVEAAAAAATATATTITTALLPYSRYNGPTSGNLTTSYTSSNFYPVSTDYRKPCLPVRMYERFLLISHNCLLYLQRKFNEHTVTSIASISILIILLPIICCYFASLMREEERRIKEQYKKLSRASSQSFIGIGEALKVKGSVVNNLHHRRVNIPTPSSLGIKVTTTTNPSTGITIGHRNDPQKLQVIELRRETYFGLVRLLKPGCRTIVLLCDTHSRPKLLSRFCQYVYPYRKNKSLQFGYLLIEKNINWYQDLLKATLIRQRDLQINPMNCIGTVLVFNGFKKHFSIYHASESKYDPEEPLFLLEESLLDNFPHWLERFFAGRVARNYVKYWPEKMR